MITNQTCTNRANRLHLTCLLLSLFGTSLTLAVTDDSLVVDDCQYASAAAARSVWKPMFGSSPVQSGIVDGLNALRLPCRFAEVNAERASWDREIRLDLSDANGFELQFFCADPAPVSYFSLYFRSGAGWYHAMFFPETTGAWNTITFNKADIVIEGNPGGWDQITGMRISAWRTRNADTEFCLGGIRKIGVLGHDALVAVLRGDAAARRSPEQARALSEGAEDTARKLRKVGINSVVLSDLEFTVEQMKQARLVVLPRNPILPDSVEAALLRYIGAGGNVLALDEAPEKIVSALKLTASELVKSPSAEQLLALASSLSPEVARQAAEAAIATIGDVASFVTYSNAVRQIQGMTRAFSAARKSLASAKSSQATARKRLAKGDFLAAHQKATLAKSQLIDAFCLAQKPLPDEFRAFWCHSAFGVEGITWDEAIRRLAESGFTAILPNMLWGGAAYYDSKVLPVANVVSEKGDQIRACLAACKKYGLQMHVWKVNWYLGSAAPKEFVTLMRAAGRLQMNSRGQEKNWLCPSHPENQQLEIDSMLEVVRNYDVDGVHFDYIRYPDNDHCYCTGCRERFERARGVALKHWPGDVQIEGELHRQWLDWRRSNITAVAKAVSERAHAIKPRIKISAAVFPNLPLDRDVIGQDWELWCQNGYLDFVCPMDYTPTNYRFESLVARQVEWAGRVPCYPGIGLSTAHFGADQLIEQINLTRRYRTGGFVIFNYGVPESRDLLPKLGMGITSAP